MAVFGGEQGIRTLEQVLACYTIIKLCKKQNKTLILSHLNEQPMKTLEKANLLDKILVADNIDAALELAENQK